MGKQSIVFIISVLSFWLGTENVLAVADKKKGQNDVVHAHRLPLTLKKLQSRHCSLRTCEWYFKTQNRYLAIFGRGCVAE